MHDDARWTRIQMWKPVREVFQAAEQLFDEAERLRTAAEAEVAAGPPPPVPRGKTPPATGAPAAYLRRRGAVREAIEGQLDPVFTEHVGPWQKHLCVTAIACFVDERERVALGALAETWRLPLLQSELLEIDDGGDRFFSQLQELLARADVHELVFEIHLLCLRAGFVGRYRDRRHELDKLTGWLTHRLLQHRPRRPIIVAADATPPPIRRRVAFLRFPVRYYAGVAAILIGAFVLLRIVSSREVEHSELAEYCHYHDGAP